MATYPVIRKSFPKIRIVKINGQKLYQVDARKQGTTGKREYFQGERQAKARANEIEAKMLSVGANAPVIDAETGREALKGQERLLPFNKTITESIDFHIQFLKAETKKKDSQTINNLATEWYNARATGINRPLRQRSVMELRKHAELLKREFGSIRLLEFTEERFQRYLDNTKVSQRRRFNLANLTGQFFNWCIKKKYTTINPVATIKGEIEIPTVTPSILTPEQAAAFMTKTQELYPMLVPYVAISLFAGLRPTECELLKWEQIHLEEKQITVLPETSKVKDTRNVPIEDNLLEWLKRCVEKQGDKPTGNIIDVGALRRNIQGLRAKMGYKLRGKNPEAAAWKEDTFRHSYASYWLAKYKDRAHLAEHMGNSIQVIKKHYKVVVSNTATEAYWSILPDGANTQIVQTITQAEIDAAKISNFAKALA